MKRITESESVFNQLEQMSTKALLEGINSQDQLVPLAVEKIIPEIEAFIDDWKSYETELIKPHYVKI